MSSHISGVFFLVHITGAWRWTHTDPPNHHDPSVLARDHLRRQTGRVLSRHSVLDRNAAQDAANTVLMRWSHPVAGLEVVGQVHLDAPHGDRALAERHARRQRAADLENEEELHRLMHLQRVLADPNLRRVWWTARFPDRFADLKTLTDALRDLPPPCERQDDDLRSDIRRFTDQLVTDLHTPQQRQVFLQALVQVLDALGHQELKTAAARWHTPHDPGSPPA